MMNPVPWLQMTNMISYQGLVRTFPRMNSQKHGKGLPDMKRYVVDNPEGQLHIFSGMGRYSYNAANNTEEQFDLPYSIGGTLIQWNVSLRGTE
ncbi:hypothetical protein [Klebsiella quasipneumoniae]|uniref:hypothetical protein n=1 Tax=Klebsiella quasipneumoniae TaxID=1463165 RepID=UPI003A4E2390